jgi:hypothetical protein
VGRVRWSGGAGHPRAPAYLGHLPGGFPVGRPCTSPTACVAVGTYQENGNWPFQTLIERYDDAGSAIAPSPGPRGAGALSTSSSAPSGLSPTARR